MNVGGDEILLPSCCCFSCSPSTVISTCRSLFVVRTNPIGGVKDPQEHNSSQSHSACTQCSYTMINVFSVVGTSADAGSTHGDEGLSE